MCGRAIADVIDVVGISRTKHNNIPSKQNNDISKCDNWIVRAIIVSI